MSACYDRYVSFVGAEWEKKSARVFVGLENHFESQDSPFWPYFIKQRKWAHDQGLDDLRVLHNFLPTLREILEDLGDDETLSLLEALEEECM